ncbi:hypothetical protein [Coleofasciculus sp.]
MIAFTDADCIPASDWIEKGVSNLSISTVQQQIFLHLDMCLNE